MIKLKTIRNINDINELKEKIATWMIMLNTTAFDGNDAGLVRDEMKELFKDKNVKVRGKKLK